MKHRRAEDTGLIFDWHRKEARGPWLAAFLLLTLFGIASLFIIFRIVTPDAPRMIARPQQMILLNPEVPAERALIHRAMDRSFTLLPNESPTFSSLPSAAAIPGFRPGIRGYEMKLKSPGSQRASNDDNAPLPVMTFDDILPPLPVVLPAAAASAKPRSSLRLRVTTSSGRKPIPPPSWHDIPLTDPERVTFRIGIDPGGRVQIALPLNSSEDPEVMDRLRTAITGTRFEPGSAGASDLEWAEAGFYWESQKEDAP
ncbi:MAG: hypothetical protein CJBNEKGG_03601 [Prosthecobacter sp.]|nr:hypothetical protein [Prosthecobacter sp.]